MKRQSIPHVEALEVKSLLSHVGVGVAAMERLHSAHLFTQTAPRVAAELTISLTTSQSSYAVGQTVQMTMTATNHTRHNVALWVGPNANVFFITQNGQTIWQSNSGIQPLVPTARRVLHPGQSLTLAASWTATGTGTFMVHNQLAPRGPVAPFNVTAGQPVPPPVPPVPPVNPPVPPVSPPVGSNLAISLTTSQSTYLVGQKVKMTMTATNDTSHDVKLWVGPNSNVFTIMQNGRVVWRSNWGPQPLYPTVLKTLAPGQSLTVTATWTATAAGTFVASNELAPQGPMATFSVMANLPVPPIGPIVGGGTGTGPVPA